MRPFDLDRFLRASRRLDLSGIDFAAVPRHPLAAPEVRCLTYMMDIETHTIVYLKEVLGTSAARDPGVTAFLSLWVYEEFWHGEPLAEFLKAAGERFEPDRPRRVRRDRGAVRRRRRGPGAGGARCGGVVPLRRSGRAGSC